MFRRTRKGFGGMRSGAACSCDKAGKSMRMRLAGAKRGPYRDIPDVCAGRETLVHVGDERGSRPAAEVFSKVVWIGVGFRAEDEIRRRGTQRPRNGVFFAFDGRTVGCTFDGRTIRGCENPVHAGLRSGLWREFSKSARPHCKSGWADCKENGARESCGPMLAVRKSLRTVWVRTDRELSVHAVPVSFPFVRGRFEAGFSGRFEIGGVRAHSRCESPPFRSAKGGTCVRGGDDAGGGGCRFRALSFRRRRGRGLRSC